MNGVGGETQRHPEQKESIALSAVYLIIGDGASDDAPSWVEAARQLGVGIATNPAGSDLVVGCGHVSSDLLSDEVPGRSDCRFIFPAVARKDAAGLSWPMTLLWSQSFGCPFISAHGFVTSGITAGFSVEPTHGVAPSEHRLTFDYSAMLASVPTQQVKRHAGDSVDALIDEAVKHHASSTGGPMMSSTSPTLLPDAGFRVPPLAGDLPGDVAVDGDIAYFLSAREVLAFKGFADPLDILNTAGVSGDAAWQLAERMLPVQVATALLRSLVM